MPDTSVKQVYVGKSLDDLKPMFDCSKEIIGRKPELLRKTAGRMLLQAKQYQMEGDEEKSYILYMKYIETVMYIRKVEGGKGNKESDSLVSTLRDCVLTAEKLSESLTKRYKALEEQGKQHPEIKTEEKGSVDQLRKETPKISEQKKKENPICNGFSEPIISSVKLFELLRDEKKKIIIFDARRSTCFDESHMKFVNCINIPEEIIIPGQSAATLEKVLPSSSRDLWSKRGSADIIVLLDWTTKYSLATPDNKLKILKDILLKWDPQTIYKHDPVMLEGGYSDWLDKYPMHTTNSHVVAPSSTNTSDVYKLLDAIQYPEINDTVLNSVVSLPKVDRSSKPMNNILSDVKHNIGNYKPLNTVINDKVINIESGNSSKTHAANINVNATSISYGPPSVQNGHSDVAAIPQSKPGVDRASKAAALQLYEERNRAIASILEKQEKLAKSSLNLEKNRLKVEEDWEQIRLRKEKEAEEELRLQLQQKEEELLKNIRNLEKEQQEKESENQELRKELERYKQKEREEALARTDMEFTEYEKEVNERIKNTEKEKRKVTHQREQKEHERISAEKKLQELKEQEKFNLEEKIIRNEKENEKQEKDTPVLSKGTYYTQLRHDGPANSSPMKRSHSSPDLAKLDESEPIMRTPLIDRTNKPSIISRPTELSYIPHPKKQISVYGVVEHGLTGLKNLGNTCYMNSIMQCLSNTSLLKNFFVEGIYRYYINKQSDTHGCIVEAVAVVIMSLWNGQYRYFVCDDLKAHVGRFREQFRTSQQQDANEFLTVLMEWLHEDLKKLKDDSRINENQGALSEARKHLIDFQRKNKSFIVDLFYGQQKSTVKCLQCKKESVTYETFSNLTLPLPNNNTCSLDDCLRLYLKAEQISGWTCPVCKEQRDAVKKFDILFLPPILIIHFKRFYIDGWYRKRQTYVDFPLEKLDMREYVNSSDNKSHTNFSLYGVSNHYGTMEGGHYTAHCKNDLKNKWFKFDDHEVTVISPSSVKTGAAYILFYASTHSNVS